MCFNHLLALKGQKVTLDKDHIILQPNEKIIYIYFLIEGTVNYFYCLDHPKEEIFLHNSSTPQNPVGWSGLFPPARSLNKVTVASKKAVFHKFEIKLL